MKKLTEKQKEMAQMLLGLYGGEWVPVLGYDGYFVSSHGQIFSIKSNAIMKQGVDKDGYKKIKLCKNGNHHKRVHRIVAESFMGKNDAMTVDHIDGIRDNNNLSNLEFVSSRENTTRGKLCNKKDKRASEFVGVSWDTCCEKWVSRICFEGVNYYLKCSESEKECSDAYQKALTAVNSGSFIEHLSTVKYERRKDNTSKYVGVYFSKKDGKFCSQILFMGKRISLVYSYDEELCHDVYMNAVMAKKDGVFLDFMSDLAEFKHSTRQRMEALT